MYTYVDLLPSDRVNPLAALKEMLQREQALYPVDALLLKNGDYTIACLPGGECVFLEKRTEGLFLVTEVRQISVTTLWKAIQEGRVNAPLSNYDYRYLV